MTQVRKLKEGDPTPELNNQAKDPQINQKKKVRIAGKDVEFDENNIDSLINEFNQTYKEGRYMSGKRKQKALQDRNMFLNSIKQDLLSGNLDVSFNAVGGADYTSTNPVVSNKHTSDYGYEFAKFLQNKLGSNGDLELDLSKIQIDTPKKDETPLVKPKEDYSVEWNPFKDLQGYETQVSSWDLPQRADYITGYINRYKDKLGGYNQELHNLTNDYGITNENIQEALNIIQDGNISDEEYKTLNPIFRGDAIRRFLTLNSDQQDEQIPDTQTTSKTPEELKERITYLLANEGFGYGDNGALYNNNVPYTGVLDKEGTELQDLTGHYYEGVKYTPEQIEEVFKSPANKNIYDYFSKFKQDRMSENEFIKAADNANYSSDAEHVLASKLGIKPGEEFAVNEITHNVNNPELTKKYSFVQVFTDKNPFGYKGIGNKGYTAIIDNETGEIKKGVIQTDTNGISKIIVEGTGEVVPIQSYNQAGGGNTLSNTLRNLLFRKNDIKVENVVTNSPSTMGVNISSGDAEKWRRVGLERDKQKIASHQYGGKIKSSGTSEIKKEASFNDMGNLTDADVADLASLGLEVTGLGASFVPVAGNAISAVTGIGSSIAEFVADVKRDGFQGKDLGTLGLNLAFDAGSLIPVAGSAAKGLKLAKGIKKYGKAIMTGLQVAGATPQVIDAFNKVISGKEMSIADWRDVARGMSALTNIGKNFAGNKKIKTTTSENTLSFKNKGVDSELKLSPDEAISFKGMNKSQQQDFVINKLNSKANTEITNLTQSKLDSSFDKAKTPEVDAKILDLQSQLTGADDIRFVNSVANRIPFMNRGNVKSNVKVGTEINPELLKRYNDNELPYWKQLRIEREIAMNPSGKSKIEISKDKIKSGTHGKKIKQRIDSDNKIINSSNNTRVELLERKSKIIDDLLLNNKKELEYLDRIKNIKRSKKNKSIYDRNIRKRVNAETESIKTKKELDEAKARDKALERLNNYGKFQEGGSFSFFPKKGMGLDGLSSFPITPIVSGISLGIKQAANKKSLRDLKSMKAPVLQAPKQINYDVKGDLATKQAYDRTAIDTMRNLTRKNLTSDIGRNTAIARQAVLDSNNLKLQGDLAYLNSLNQSKDRALGIQIQNEQAKNAVLNQNIQAQNALENKKKEFDVQHRLTKMGNIDTFLKDVTAQTKDYINSKNAKDISLKELDNMSKNAKFDADYNYELQNLSKARSGILAKFNNNEAEALKHPEAKRQLDLIGYKIKQLALQNRNRQINQQKDLINSGFTLYKLGGKLKQ